MKLYCPLSIVNESALYAINEFHLVDRPDVVEAADMIAVLRKSELTWESVREAIDLVCPEIVN